MIETTKVDGRNAIVAYMTLALEPVANKDKAELVKVSFLDETGGTVFLVPDTKPEKKKALDPMQAEVYQLARKHGFSAGQVRFSSKLEWVVNKRGKMVLRTFRLDPRTKSVTIFSEAIEANYPNPKAHMLTTLDYALKLLGNGQWDEDEHPRDEDGKFAVSGGGAGGNSDSGDTGPGFGGGLVLPDDKPATSSGSTPKGKVKVKPEDFEKDKIRVSAKDKVKFAEKFSDRIGSTPADFTNDFLGGVKAGEVTITEDSSGNWVISGNIYDGDTNVGNFTRNLDFDGKKAYSAYFSINGRARGKDTGKQVLAGNVETYKKLGFNQVSVSANIDVGGYAWAKYGYVPTQSSWNDIRQSILSQLGSGDRRSVTSNTYTPEEWSMISDYDQTMIYDNWKNDSFQEFYDNEVTNWHESGEALRFAKQETRDSFNSGDDYPEWSHEALDEVRAELKEDGVEIPYTNAEILKSMGVEYDDDDYEGRKDPEFTFNDDKLGNPDTNIAPAFDPNQQTLPGIEPLEPYQALTDDMREKITDKMVEAFNDKAESEESNMEPPDYLRDSAYETMESYWDQYDDDEKYRIAERGGWLPEIEMENDDEEERLPLEDVPEDENALLKKLANSPDPKSMWAIADSSRGKELLLGTSWSGVLKFNDEEAMSRFNSYVGKSSKKKAA